jgi:hypothetical protein
MARLVFRDSQGREGAVELSPTETVYVGRGLECAIRTDDGMVSRRHSQIRMEGGRFVVEDLGSANGTHLNNTRIQKQALGHNDMVQCGSLMIRFLDEGAVNVVQPRLQPQGSAPPAKKGGTMVLERSEAPPLPGYGAAQPSSFGAPSYPPTPGPAPYGGQPGAAPYGGQPGAAPYGGQPGVPANPYGAPPAMPGSGSIPPPSPTPGYGAARAGGFGGSVASQSNASPYGGPPAMPSPAGTPANMPYGGPPGMPGGAPGVSATGPTAYGGPPAMPGQPVRPPADSPSVFGRGGPMGPVGAQQARPDAAENKVLVDLGLEYDPNKADAEIKSLRAQLEKASTNYEREVADGKRIRAEAAAVRERAEELKAQIKDREDQVAAHDRVADELRDELQQTRNELNRSRGELAEMAENMGARERQAARALEDTAKLREDIEDKNRQLMELSRTKDEGWKKLNEQLTEIEHLREVINEQERMLEERRVGLISQEEVIKELRSEKEKNIKVIAQLRAERDEANANASRSAAQISGLEEENRRLGRLMVEAQTDAGRGGGAQPDHLMKMTNDIRELRVELKKVEADRERFQEQYAVADRDREKLEGKLAQIEVELQEAIHGKLAAESARNVAQDALAKAEVARHKSAEEALNASKAREAASTGGDDARRELDRLRKKIAEVEKVQVAAPSAVDTKELQLEREAGERKLKDANERAAAAERSLKSLQAEVDAAKTDAAKARAEAARAKAAADAHAEAVVDPGATTVNMELAKVVQEVYEAINDILSEMRNNMILVQGELPNLKGDGATLQAVGQAVEALVDNAETAKGALRGLRDLASADG